MQSVFTGRSGCRCFVWSKPAVRERGCLWEPPAVNDKQNARARDDEMVNPGQNACLGRKTPPLSPTPLLALLLNPLDGEVVPLCSFRVLGKNLLKVLREVSDVLHVSIDSHFSSLPKPCPRLLCDIGSKGGTTHILLLHPLVLWQVLVEDRLLEGDSVTESSVIDFTW